MTITEAEIRTRVAELAELHYRGPHESYHEFHEDRRAFFDWQRLISKVPGFDGLTFAWDDGFIEGIVVSTRLNDPVDLLEPYHEGTDGSWIVTPESIERTVQQILNLDVPAGDDLEIAEDALADLRCARDRLVHIGALKAADRVRNAIRSAEGAVRHALTAQLRKARNAKKQKTTPAKAKAKRAAKAKRKDA